MVTAPGQTISITTKKGCYFRFIYGMLKMLLVLTKLLTVTLNGPASWTNGTAAGTFASTGLPGNTVGAHDGTINFN